MKLTTEENSENIRKGLKGLYCSWSFPTAFSYAVGQPVEEHDLGTWERNEKRLNFKGKKWYK